MLVKTKVFLSCVGQTLSGGVRVASDKPNAVCVCFFYVSTVVVSHKTLGRGPCLINQNAIGNQGTRGMLFFRQEHIQREKRTESGQKNLLLDMLRKRVNRERERQK